MQETLIREDLTSDIAINKKLEGLPNSSGQNFYKIMKSLKNRETSDTVHYYFLRGIFQLLLDIENSEFMEVTYSRSSQSTLLIDTLRQLAGRSF